MSHEFTSQDTIAGIVGRFDVILGDRCTFVIKLKGNGRKIQNRCCKTATFHFDDYQNHNQLTPKLILCMIIYELCCSSPRIPRLPTEWKRCCTESCLACPHFPRLVRESVHWPGNNVQFPFDVQIKFTFSVRVVDNGWLFHTCTSQFWLAFTYAQVLFVVVFSKIFILLLSLGQNKSTLIFTSSNLVAWKAIWDLQKREF